MVTESTFLPGRVIMMTSERSFELAWIRDCFQSNFGRSECEHRSDWRYRARPTSSVFPRIVSEYAPCNEQSQHDKQQAEEQPAHQKFPHVVGIEAKAQDQPGEQRYTMTFSKLTQRVLYPARMRSIRFSRSDQENGERRDTVRPSPASRSMSPVLAVQRYIL